MEPIVIQMGGNRCGKTQLIREFLASIDPDFKPDFSKLIVINVTDDGKLGSIHHLPREQAPKRVLIIDDSPILPMSHAMAAMTYEALRDDFIDFPPPEMREAVVEMVNGAVRSSFLGIEPEPYTKAASDAKLRELGFEPRARYYPGTPPPKQFYKELYRKDGSRKRRSKK